MQSFENVINTFCSSSFELTILKSDLKARGAATTPGCRRRRRVLLLPLDGSLREIYDR